MARGKKKALQREPEELRLTDLELALLERDDLAVQGCARDVELADTKLLALALEYQTTKAKLVDMRKNAKLKHEGLILQRNKRLAEIEQRLRELDPEFSFKDYTQQHDGTLVPDSALVAPKPQQEASGMMSTS